MPAGGAPPDVRGQHALTADILCAAHTIVAPARDASVRYITRYPRTAAPRLLPAWPKLQTYCKLTINAYECSKSHRDVVPWHATSAAVRTTVPILTVSARKGWRFEKSVLYSIEVQISRENANAIYHTVPAAGNEIGWRAPIVLYSKFSLSRATELSKRPSGRRIAEANKQAVRGSQVARMPRFATKSWEASRRARAMI
eukprot:IDg3946t1